MKKDLCPKPSNIVKVCAWCPDKEEKDKEAKKNGFTVSHGICKKCSKIHFKD